MSLATAYALADVLSLKHSLHRKVTNTPAFYLVYAGLIAAAAATVLTPGALLALITNAVQTLAGVLLPSATVFQLLLCSDKAVLNPWVNGRAVNLFTGAAIAGLVMLSIILTASVLYPDMGSGVMLSILGGGAAVTALGVVIVLSRKAERVDRSGGREWRMPPPEELAPAHMSRARRLWIGVLRGYLLIAGGLVLVRIVQSALNHPAGGGGPEKDTLDGASPIGPEPTPSRQAHRVPDIGHSATRGCAPVHTARLALATGPLRQPAHLQPSLQGRRTDLPRG